MISPAVCDGPKRRPSLATQRQAENLDARGRVLQERRRGALDGGQRSRSSWRTRPRNSVRSRSIWSSEAKSCIVTTTEAPTPSSPRTGAALTSVLSLRTESATSSARSVSPVRSRPVREAGPCRAAQCAGRRFRRSPQVGQRCACPQQCIAGSRRTVEARDVKGDGGRCRRRQPKQRES